MEPIDAKILDTLVKEYLDLEPKERADSLFVKELLIKEMKLEEGTCESALRNLIRLGVLKPGVVSSAGVKFGDHPVSSYKDTEMVGVTALGVDFYHAVNLEKTQK
jgi:hypothetical protein